MNDAIKDRFFCCFIGAYIFCILLFFTFNKILPHPHRGMRVGKDEGGDEGGEGGEEIFQEKKTKKCIKKVLMVYKKKSRTEPFHSYTFQ